MKRWIVLVALMLSAVTVFAEDAAPSDASILELMAVTQSRKLLDAQMGQIDGVMQSAFKKSLGDRTMTPEQQQIMDEMRTRTVALFREEMKWESLEPLLIDIYKKSFTQDEIDGMLTFYRSPTGQAVIAKMPQVMQYTMKTMQERMLKLIPQMQQIQSDAMARLKAVQRKATASDRAAAPMMDMGRQ